MELFLIKYERHRQDVFFVSQSFHWCSDHWGANIRKKFPEAAKNPSTDQIGTSSWWLDITFSGLI